MIAVDTSVVVRYLVGTPTEEARRAASVMDGTGPIGLAVVVLSETAHVLRTQYGVSRADVLATMIELITRKSIQPLGLPRDAVIEALLRARALPGSPLPDALVVATAREAGATPLYSFDQAIGKHGLQVKTP